MSEKKLFTSESVTEGHPDKVADQISDAVLDAILSQDEKARVACETLVTTGLAFVAGEITTNAYVDIPSIARGVIKDIGYTDAAFGFDSHTCSVLTSLDEQSPDIAMGVDRRSRGDQLVRGSRFGAVRGRHGDRCAAGVEPDRGQRRHPRRLQEARRGRLERNQL